MFSEFFGNDPHTGFIVASYGISIAVLGFLSLYLVRDLNKQWRLLRELEKDTDRKSWAD